MLGSIAYAANNAGKHKVVGLQCRAGSLSRFTVTSHRFCESTDACPASSTTPKLQKTPCLAAFLVNLCFGGLVVSQDVFPDKALEKAIRWEVFEKRYNDQPITIDDVKSISQVIARGKEIKSLEGLQHCKSIMKIDLANNQITDLTPIADLKLVQSLDLSGNQIASLDALKNLSQMQYLQISKNQVKDLAPIAAMIKLNALYANENQVTNVQPIVGLKKLWTLQLAGNPIESIPDVSELKHLKTLNLRNCKLKKIDFLANLSELNLLMLDQNPLENTIAFGVILRIWFCETVRSIFKTLPRQ